MPEGVSVSRSVLADQVKEQLLDMIVRGTYPPDSRIVETSVAKALGTSQAPVREALRGLEAMGVVEIIPFRGARVRGFSEQELLEAYVVRSALEALGARLAVPLLSDTHLAELEALVSAMQEAAAAGDLHRVAGADAEFHRRIIELAGNSALLRLWKSLEPSSRTYLTLALPGADPQWTADLHLPVMDALRRRDPDAVVRALEEHFSEASAKLAAELQASAGAGDDPAPVPAAADPVARKPATVSKRKAAVRR